MKVNWKRILIVLVIVFIFGIIVSGAAFLYLVSKQHEKGTPVMDIVRIMISKPGQIAFKDKDSLKILVMGLDYNYNERGIHYTKDARSDTIFVVRVDREGKELNMLSIPRDSRVELADGYGYDKVNAAYSLGGVELAKKTIGNFLETDIDHYVIIRSYAMKDLVDAIGGVAVDVEKDMDYDDNWGHLHVHLKKGIQRLNGEQAVGYCRFRHDPEGDRGRIRRQQQFIAALIKELKKPSNLVNADKISRAFKKMLETDMSVLDLMDLAKVYKNFKMDRITKGVIDGDDENIGGASYIIPDDNKKKMLVQRLLEGREVLDPADIKIQVLNGSGTQGAAAQAAEILKQKGYNVVDVGNAPTQDCEFTEIVDYNNRPNMALSIMDIIGKTQLSRDDSGINETLDFTIIIGKDWHGPPSESSLPAPEVTSAQKTNEETPAEKPLVEETTEVQTDEPAPGAEETPAAPAASDEKTDTPPDENIINLEDMNFEKVKEDGTRGTNIPGNN